MPYFSLGSRTCQCLLVVCAGTVLATAVEPFMGTVVLPDTAEAGQGSDVVAASDWGDRRKNLIFAPTNPISILQTLSGFSFPSSAPVLSLIWTMSCHLYPTRLQPACSCLIFPEIPLTTPAAVVIQQPPAPSLPTSSHHLPQTPKMKKEECHNSSLSTSAKHCFPGRENIAE